MTMSDYELCYEDEEEEWNEQVVLVLNNRQKDTLICQLQPPPTITRQSSISQSRLLRLPPDLLFRILQFIPQRCTLSSLVTTANYLKHLLYSPSAEHLWNEDQHQYQFCIDSYCPTCSFVKRKKQGNSQHVLSLLGKCPLHSVKMHCFITDLPALLVSLANPQCLQALDLTLTNKTNSPPLEDLLSDVAIDLASLSLGSVIHARKAGSMTSISRIGSDNKYIDKNDNKNDELMIPLANASEDSSSYQPRREGAGAGARAGADAGFAKSGGTKLGSGICGVYRAYFPALTDLSLDSSHLQHVNPLGRAKLLDILGGQLENLSFSGLSPPGVFSILSSRCPHLLRLRVDRAASHHDLSTFQSSTIRELELCRATFLLTPGSLNGLPGLRKLHYSPSFRCDSAQMEFIIGAAPQTLESISLEVASQCANPVLHAISRRLHMVRSVSLQGAHEIGCLSEEAITSLGRSCPFLISLDISSSRSVNDLTFDQSSFAMLASFPSLTTLRVKYEEATVASLSALLLQADSLRVGGSVSLWERKKWIGAEKWTQMEQTMAEIGMKFPTCSVRLEATI